MMRKRSIEERFWEKVDKTPGLGPNGDCWEWTASKSKHGYGRIEYNNRCCEAHRISWFLHTDAFPQLCVLHKCDNPSCVHPYHLFLGTRNDNIIDMDKKKRRKPVRGIHQKQSKLIDNDIRNIRKMLQNGEFITTIAKKYGVCHQLISRIKCGQLWSHVK